MTTTKLFVRRLIGDTETPVGAMLKLGAEEAGTFLFESIQGGHTLGRYSFLGLDPQVWFRIKHGVASTAPDSSFIAPEVIDLSPVEALRHFVERARAESDEELPPMASGAFGYVGYDMIQYVEPVDISAKDDLDLDEVLLVIPRIVIIFDHLYQQMILVARVEEQTGAATQRKEAEALLDQIEKRLGSPAPPPPPTTTTTTAAKQTPGEHQITSNTDRDTFYSMVEKARDYIIAGDIFQVVPSQRLSTPYTHKSISLYRALRRLNPSAFMFHMNLGEVRVVGSSPEILVRLRAGRVAIRPLAGTRPRSGDPVEDQARSEELLADEKERAEHLMLLDLGRNDVGRVAAFGSVEVTEQFTVEFYSHVMHIVSHVEGDLREGLDAVDALLAGFPAGTVSGAPKIRAMQIIDELEVSRRGIYGGAVGYFGWNGDLDTCIALRTGVIKDEMLHIQAGGGIVLDSIPEYEFAETLHKANALIKAVELSASYEAGP